MPIFSYSDKTFKLSEKLSIYKVSEIKRSILDAYKSESMKSETFYLDVSEAESIDSAVFQLIVSLKKTIETGKGKLVLKKSCQHFDVLMGLLGIPESFFTKAA